MLAGGELAGAVGYQTRWLVLAACLLLAVAAWNIGVVVWGRPRRRRRVRPDRAAGPVELRARFLELIDRVEQDHRAGRLDSREAHLRLSGLVREFVEAVEGVPVTTMTLAHLRAEQRPALDGVLDVVATAYPPSFAPDGAAGPVAVEHALEQARKVVASWR